MFLIVFLQKHESNQTDRPASHIPVGQDALANRMINDMHELGVIESGIKDISSKDTETKNVSRKNALWEGSTL